MPIQVPKEAPPTFKEPAKWSREFRDFVEASLIKNQTTRATSEQLLNYPFIKNVCRRGASLAPVIVLAIPFPFCHPPLIPTQPQTNAPTKTPLDDPPPHR